MPITGLWISKTDYLVTDSERGRSEAITILATKEELEDYFNCQELEHWAREEIVQGWKKEEQEAKRPYTKDERRDLGGALFDIRASQRHRRESNHGRWW